MQLIYIGIAFFLFKVGENMLDTTIRPEIVHIICEKQFSNNLTICSHLHLYKEEENSVQKEASLYLFLYRFVTNVPSAVTGLYIGAWSDKNGRRLPMIGSCVGNIIGALIYIGSIFIRSSVISVWCVLFGTLVQGSFGKNAVFTMAVNCFIAEESDAGNLTKHVGIIFSMNYFGQCLGAFFVGVIINSLVLYSTVIGINSVAVSVVFILVKESKNRSDKQMSERSELPTDCKAVENHIKDLDEVTKFKDLKQEKVELNDMRIQKETSNKQEKKLRTYFVCLEGLKPYLHVFMRERKNVRKSFLVIMIFLIFTNTCDVAGNVDVLLLYVTRNPFNWSSSLYSYYLASETLTIGIVLLIVIPVLSKMFKMSDFKLLLVGLLCKITRYISTGLCNKSWMIFALIGVSSATSFMTCLRSVLGKCVEEEELGKIYSLYSIIELASKIIGSVVYISIYSAAVSFDPRITFFVMGLANFTMLLTVIKFRKGFEQINTFEMTPIIVGKTPSTKYTVDINSTNTNETEK